MHKGASLAQLFEQELSKSVPPSAHHKLSGELEKRQVVFVAYKDTGILRPFKDNIAGLVQHLGYKDARMAYTMFFDHYEKSSELLTEQLRKIFTERQKPLIVIGNPGTSPDCLMAVLQHPDLLEQGVIEKMVLLHPAFGSPIVDQANNSNWIARLIILFARIYLRGNYDKFSTVSVQNSFKAKLASVTEVDKQTLDQKVFWVRASAKNKFVTPWLYPAYLILKSRGDSDAIAYTDNQILGDIGCELTHNEPIKADHWDLNVSLPFSNSLPFYRQAFTRALLRSLFE